MTSRNKPIGNNHRFRILFLPLLLAGLVILLSGCASVPGVGDISAVKEANELAITCRTDEALAVVDRAVQSGGMAGAFGDLQRVVILRDAGRTAEAETAMAARNQRWKVDAENAAEAERAVDESVAEMRAEREKRTGHPTCDNEKAAALPDNPLAGTQWRLVEIQSMDDATGTLRPENPSLFTMHLNTDGSVSMRLDCNRAKGSWSIEPAGDGHSGRFEFGQMAGTRALCRPPHLDEHVLAQAEYVRGYLLKDGRLNLSLMADGGILVWEPYVTAIPFETAPDADLEAAILRAAPDYTRVVVAIGGKTARYLHGRIDLNDDGRKEVFAYLLGSIFCGTGGCDLFLFTVGDGGYRLVDTFPITRLPVIVAPVRTAGWHDLIRLESGGGAPATYVRHLFDGDAYVEKERWPAGAPPDGVNVLTEEFTFQDGFPLKPRK